MQYTIVGLGNPGEEYKNTRHNAGRIAVSIFAAKNNSSEFSFDKRLNLHKTKVNNGKIKAAVILPDTYMNKSGNAVKNFIKSPKMAEKLVVVHDDLDIAFGKFKISFGKNSGGNKGVESIIRAIKTKNFIRIRIGIAPVSESGKIKKPKGEKRVEKFILGKFTPIEMRKLRLLSSKISDEIESIILNGYQKAVSMRG